MNDTVSNNIVRVEGLKHFSTDDVQIKECPVSLMLKGVELTRTVITASDDEAKKLWALGCLKCGGSIEKFDDVGGIDIEEDKVYVRAKNKFSSICVEPVKVLWSTKAGIIFDAVRSLGDAPLFIATGGVHVAALFDPEGQRLFEAEDIGRHNTVDKAIGWALTRNVDLSGVMLITSGRMPKDMVAKAWMAGIGLMASVSAASADGIDTARLANITLAGFVRGDRMNIYADSDPSRIELR